MRGDFFLLHETEQAWITGILFFAVLVQYLLFMYCLYCRAGILRYVIDFAVFLGGLVLLAFCLAARKGSEVFLRLPWQIIVYGSFLLVIYAAKNMLDLYKVYRNRISPSSVHFALNNLKSGILFADPMGRVVLCNTVMARLCDELIGGYPRTLKELSDGVEERSRAGFRDRVSFSDSTIWQFQHVPLSGEGVEGFIQVLAKDITELVGVNESLKKENLKLIEANRQMGQMIERMEERIREKETLQFKVKIHNEIGTSLIMLSALADGESAAGDEEAMQTLHFALSCFFGSPRRSESSLELVLKQADEMGITLLISGDNFPKGEAAERLAAAVSECLTNCVRHAGGRTVEVRLKKDNGMVFAWISNDGKAPSGPVTEGGGLRALRRSLEKAGGSMEIISSPKFVLKVIVPVDKT